MHGSGLISRLPDICSLAGMYFNSIFECNGNLKEKGYSGGRLSCCSREIMFHLHQYENAGTGPGFSKWNLPIPIILM